MTRVGLQRHRKKKSLTAIRLSRSGSTHLHTNNSQKNTNNNRHNKNNN